jgi:hypothetical protein
VFSTNTPLTPDGQAAANIGVAASACNVWHAATNAAKRNPVILVFIVSSIFEVKCG